MLDSPFHLDPLEGRTLLSGLPLPIGNVKTPAAKHAIVTTVKHPKRVRSGLAGAPALQSGFAGAYRGSWTSDQATGQFTLTIFTNADGELYGVLALQIGDQTLVQQSQVLTGRNGKFTFLFVSTQRIVRVEGRFNTSVMNAELTLAGRDGGMQASLVGRLPNAPQARH